MKKEIKTAGAPASTRSEDRRALFPPLTRAEMDARGWEAPDFVYVCGDAYVDHPSFGCAIITRVLEHAGFRVAVLAQPDWHTAEDFRRFGRPRLGFLVSAGNVDSMVAHYTVSRRLRGMDYYSPGGKPGRRPDRASIVYANRIREAWGDVPIILGGLEASLRRLAHYDYWDGKMRRGLLLDSGADLLSYGMGERALVRIAQLLDRGVPVRKIRDVRGTVWVGREGDKIHFPCLTLPAWQEVREGGQAYAASFAEQYRQSDSVRGQALVEPYDGCVLVQNPPMPPLEGRELDEVYELPYQRTWHPDYDSAGGVPAIAEVKFSITHNRGCFGACNFCAIAFHQGREVRARSPESVLKEAEALTRLPDFKGYIHDVGGPTANFRAPACDKQLKHGVCPNRRCLSPDPCPHLKVDHSEYAGLLRDIEALPGVKRVFVRSGIRFDYLLYDKDPSFFRQLVERHVSGQLKVAPEHCSDHALVLMGKPRIAVYEAFRRRYFDLCRACGKEQYLVPYLMSSHPGATLRDAVEMAVWLKREGLNPEQVQDFYPTPGTVSTVMYATGIHPLTGEEVYVCRDPHEKRLQRALLQYANPKNAPLVREALVRAGRQDLIGYAKDCLVRPEEPARGSQPPRKAAGASPFETEEKNARKTPRGGKTPAANRAAKGGSPESKAPVASKTKKNGLSDRWAADTNRAEKGSSRARKAPVASPFETADKNARKTPQVRKASGTKAAARKEKSGTPAAKMQPRKGKK